MYAYEDVLLFGRSRNRECVRVHVEHTGIVRVSRWSSRKKRDGVVQGALCDLVVDDKLLIADC